MGDVVLFIIALWVGCGLLGAAIQYFFQAPKSERGWALAKYMILIGLLFGPINLLATFEKR